MDVFEYAFVRATADGTAVSIAYMRRTGAVFEAAPVQDKSAALDVLSSTLALMGEQGWELVSVSGDGSTWYLKRQKEAPRRY